MRRPAALATLLRRLLPAALALAALAPAPLAPAAAAPPPWPTTPFAYAASHQSLAGVLDDLGASVGTRVVVSPKVRAQVDGRFEAASPLAFLDQISRRYGLTWYYDNGTLTVYRADEAQRRTLHIDPEAAEGFRQAAEQTGLVDPRFTLSVTDGAGVVVAAGPPAYVQAVASLAAAFAPKPVEAPPVLDFRTYRLRYAQADDRTIFYRDKEVVIPGVASILRGLVSGNVAGGTGTQVKQLPSTVIRLGGTGLIANGDLRQTAGIPPYPGQGNANGGDAGPPPDQAGGDAAGGNGAEAVIQADPRANAVIVRDRRDRLPYYDRLVASLDIPVALVEIEATMAEVNTTHIADLGIRWQATKDGVGTIGFGDINANPTPNGLNSAITIGNNFNVATMTFAAASSFLTKVNALETTGDATISSRPSVLTTDNLEALIDLSTTFYVKVAGAYQVDLFPVTVGTMLKVTPHVLMENGKPRIRVAVTIEDGTVLSSAQASPVDSIPQITRNTISTEATVTQQQSLLIGGHYFEQDTGDVNKIPFLADIPVVGLLFQEKGKSNQRRQRLFMITPRIVELPRT
jgi:type III secretion protein C